MYFSVVRNIYFLEFNIQALSPPLKNEDNSLMNLRDPANGPCEPDLRRDFSFENHSDGRK
jgi:hypothetical protein